MQQHLHDKSRPESGVPGGRGVPMPWRGQHRRGRRRERAAADGRLTPRPGAACTWPTAFSLLTAHCAPAHLRAEVVRSSSARIAHRRPAGPSNHDVGVGGQPLVERRPARRPPLEAAVGDAAEAARQSAPTRARSSVRPRPMRPFERLQDPYGLAGVQVATGCRTPMPWQADEVPGWFRRWSPGCRSARAQQAPGRSTASRPRRTRC